jgi:hypothetical protein
MRALLLVAVLASGCGPGPLTSASVAPSVVISGPRSRDVIRCADLRFVRDPGTPCTDPVEVR